MPIDWVVLGSAALAGLLGGVHCALMCGGIATGLGSASGSPRIGQALLVNLARVLGYVLAGAIAGGLGGGIVQLTRIPGLLMALRAATGLVLVIAALRLLGIGKGWTTRGPQAVWGLLAPIQRRLWPPETPARQLLLGVLWGWLPCGLSSTLLVAAWLQASALRGALVMAAFGLATLPLMVPLTWSGSRAMGWLQQRGLRRGAAVLLLLAGVLTMTAPLLARHPAIHGVLSALGCAVP